MKNQKPTQPSRRHTTILPRQFVESIKHFGHKGGFRKLTVEQAEAENMAADEGLGQTSVPFGCNSKWKGLIAQMQPGDELWEFSSSRKSWQHLCGSGGIALVRCGKVVASMFTKMN